MRSAALVVAGLVACGTASTRSPQEPAYGGAAGSPIEGEAGAGLSEGGSKHEPAGAAAGVHEGGTDPTAGVDGSGGSNECDPRTGVDPASAPLVRGLELRQVAVFQGVKVPIMELGYELASRKVNLVTGRPALLRAYVQPMDAWQPRVVTARLTLDDVQYEQSSLISGASTDAQLASTFNFEIAADLITEDTSYSVELLEAESCLALAGDDASARFPEESEAPFGALPGATLEVRIVPVEFDTGSITLAPDTSVEQLERLRTQLLRLFPISGIDISVREPLTAVGTTMVEVLDQVAALREQEGPAPNVVYYGLVRLTETHEEYCSPSCVLGASFNGEAPSVGVGVGIGYTGEQSARTFAHELGHVYGRPHTPCGVVGDSTYPYSGGRIGSWGYDVGQKMLFNPNAYTDFMGYCQPIWVSDHTYEHLRQFIAQVEPALQVVEALDVARTNDGEQSYRSLVLQRGKPAVWGIARKLGRSFRGAPELARVFNARGGEADQVVTIFRRRVADAPAEVVYVPEWVSRGWASLSLARERIPLPFGGAP
jgi:hypothetical protein